MRAWVQSVIVEERIRKSFQFDKKVWECAIDEKTKEVVVYFVVYLSSVSLCSLQAIEIILLFRRIKRTEW